MVGSFSANIWKLLYGEKPKETSGLHQYSRIEETEHSPNLSISGIAKIRTTCSTRNNGIADIPATATPSRNQHNLKSANPWQPCPA